jgi:hypothetical protein
VTLCGTRLEDRGRGGRLGMVGCFFSCQQQDIFVLGFGQEEEKLKSDLKSAMYLGAYRPMEG